GAPGRAVPAQRGGAKQGEFRKIAAKLDWRNRFLAGFARLYPLGVVIRPLAARQVGFGLLEVLETALRQEPAAGEPLNPLARPGSHMVRQRRAPALERGNLHALFADEHHAPA